MKKIKCEVYTRVVGYFRPVGSWNEGKEAEFNDRKEFSETISLKSMRGTTEKTELTVYGLPMCMGCQDLKKKLIEHEIAHVYKNAKENQRDLLSLRLSELPVVILGKEYTEGATIEDVLKLLKNNNIEAQKEKEISL